MSSRPRDGQPALTCPLCGHTARLWLQHGERELWRCESCAFAWIPQGVARSASGASIYEDDPTMFFAHQDYYLDESAQDAARDKLEWVARSVPKNGELLDVGANLGQFVAVARNRFTVHGLEPSLSAVEYARAQGLPVEAGSVYAARPEFNGRFDAVTMFDVIEHLEHPADALRNCRNWLTPQGRLFITTPDTSSWPARLLGRQWYYIDMKEHISMFNRANLAGLLRREGWRVVATRTFARRYRLSYIEQRLGYLAGTSAVLRVAHIAAQPLRLFPRVRIPINLGDVLGVVADRVD